MNKAPLHGLGFVLALALALPCLSMALFFYFVGRVAASGGWLLALFELLFSGVVILPMVTLTLFALLVAGLLKVTRPWACAALLAVDLGSVATVALIAPPRDAGDWAIALPTLASMALCAWLIAASRDAPALLQPAGLGQPGVAGQPGSQPVVHVGPDAAPFK